LQIIARTDARAVEGLDRAIERAQHFAEAGADITFVEAPLSVEELARISKEIKVPQVANIVYGGHTPDPGREAFARMGFAIVLYANAGLQAALHAATQVYSRLKADGSLANVGDMLASFESRQKSVDKDRWDALESKYHVP
jgi:2-methylisocitrate lyase-like PEP mutase family enzyme